LSENWSASFSGASYKSVLNQLFRPARRSGAAQVEKFPA
jgi:hypothetical protein